MSKLKQFTVNLIAGANVGTVLLMLASGYSDRIHPADFPLLSILGMTFPFFLIANLLFLLFWLTVKWRKIWIPLVGFLLAYVPISIYIPINGPGHDEDATVKVVSWNVCTYGGNFKYENGFAVICDYLKRQDADIVCLQEDVDSWRRFVFQEYTAKYPYNDTLIFQNTKSCMNGVGIHSKYPILRKERIPYESKNNGSVAFYLKKGDDTLLVINNHLESTHLTKNDRSNYQEMISGRMGRDTMRAESRLLLSKLSAASAKRASQADAVQRYIAAHSQYPLIVCGDFNDTPISYTRRAISQGLTDCFAAVGNGLGLSFFQKGFFFRIDHIFCSDAFEPVRCVVDPEIDYSDHQPIICWLKKREKP